MQIEVVRYEANGRQAWDACVRQSTSGYFLFLRAYMEYHADRYADHSLLLLSGGRVVAVLPAHEKENMLHSHGGLSHGGLVVADPLTPIESLFDALKRYVRGQGFSGIRYKLLPPFYHQADTAPELPLLDAGARLIHREWNLVALLAPPHQWQCRRRRGIRKADRNGITVQVSDQYPSFWPILEEVLAQRHHVRPVHSLAEMQYLAQALPQHIRLLTATYQGEAVAGAVVYVHPRVLHVQYMAASETGKRLGALDRIIAELFDLGPTWLEVGQLGRLSFGVSTLRDTGDINQGLFEWKAGWQTIAWPHDEYFIESV